MDATTTPTNHQPKEATVNFESEVRNFAVEFPTPNVLRALALCEAGTLPWDQVAEVLRRSLGHALEVVAA